VNTPPSESTPPPESTPPSAGKIPQHNTANLFPAGQCTWWATERYHTLTGYYVPWTTNANANQWTARAYEFGWHVSDQPSVGAIIDFQAGVQLASDVGHVAIVEKINSDGSLTTSNMNILGHPFGSVVDLTNHPGPGVTFITYQ
jgi:surface antigen